MLWSRGLVGSWKLENTALDGSGNGNNGTVHGATYADGQFGRCLSCDGSGDYVDCGSGASLKLTSPFTIAARIKLMAATFPDNTTNWHIVDSETYQQNGICFRVNGGSPYLFIRTSQAGTASNLPGAQILSKNVWYHVAVVQTGTTGNLYIDALLDKTGTLNPAIAATNNFTLSRSNQSMNGLTDEIHAWNRALSAADIRRVAMGMHPIW